MKEVKYTVETSDTQSGTMASCNTSVGTPPRAANWIETVLLPELETIISRQYGLSQMTSTLSKEMANYHVGFKHSCEDIKQFILSRKDEWKGK